MKPYPWEVPAWIEQTRPRRRAEYSDDAAFGLREPGTIVCRCWNLRRRVAISVLVSYRSSDRLPM